VTNLFSGAETVYVTLWRRTFVSSPEPECASCRQQGHVGSKTPPTALSFNLHSSNEPGHNVGTMMTAL